MTTFTWFLPELFLIFVATIIILIVIYVFLNNKECKHCNTCVFIKDNTNWVIGTICTKCHEVWLRKDIPDYETRLLLKA